MEPERMDFSKFRREAKKLQQRKLLDEHSVFTSLRGVFFETEE
jgi:hypothetical protein